MSRPNLQDVSKLLDSENMDSETAGIGVDSSDPVVETAIRLSLDQLTEYDRNPRIAANQEYEALKESLRNTGSGTVALLVTKRPGEERYFPKMGGNTRIRILKELYAESGDEKYFWISCKFQPFTSEADLLIGHLAENDNRADYIFLDRARGIRAIREQFEADGAEDEELSQRRFIALLIEHGYPKVSQTSLIRYNYVLDVLYPLIPQALLSGMSTKETMRIQKLQKQIEEFCKRLFTDEALLEQLVEIFPESLSRLDSAQGLDLKNLEKKTLTVLAAYIAKKDDADQRTVHDRLISHWMLHLQDPSLTPSWPESKSEDEIDLGLQDDRTFAPLYPGNGWVEASDRPEGAAYSPSSSIPPPSPPTRSPEHRGSENESQDRKLAKLREEAWNAALLILKEHRAEALLVADSDASASWLGFRVAVPNPGADPFTGRQADIWWWMYLLTESDQRLDELSRSGEDKVAAELRAEMAKRGQDQTAESMMNVIAHGIEDRPDRRAFTRDFSDWTFTNMVMLMARIRQIRRTLGRR